MSKKKPKDIEAQIKALEAEREKDIAERSVRYDTDLQEKFKAGTEKHEGRLRRFRNKPTKVEEIKEWALINAEGLKEFIKYGSNKVLDQIRIRNQANVIAREEIEKLKKKESWDMKQLVTMIAVCSIIGVIVYVTVINFMDYSTITKDLTAEKIKVGDVSGKLAACQSELANYKPGQPREINTVTSPPDSGGGQVIQG